LVLALASVLGAGCGQGGAPSGPSGKGDGKEKYLLTKEPVGARGVKDVRQDAKDGDEVVILGRIGGDVNPWVEGRAVFWIIDPAVKSCKETADDACPTPWDCCCTPKEELRRVMATVKVVDDKGQTVAVDARQLLGLKELQTVVVHGRARRDDKGNLTVLADGLFVRP
jgi:hypothetical protein